MVAAGTGMAASAVTARGTDLRGERSQDLRQLVLSRAGDANRQERSVNSLRMSVDQFAKKYSTEEIQKIRLQVTKQRTVAGLSNITSDGIIVTLNDAPHKAGDVIPADVDPNWLLVHQEDIQNVVNAMWAGGATAVSVMDQRIVNSSAVKCVGSTVLVNGQVFSPPFVIKATGNVKQLIDSLDNDDNVSFFKDLATSYGLTFTLDTGFNLEIGAYTGLIGTHYSKPISN